MSLNVPGLPPPNARKKCQHTEHFTGLIKRLCLQKTQQFTLKSWKRLKKTPGLSGVSFGWAFFKEACLSFLKQLTGRFAKTCLTFFEVFEPTYPYCMVGSYQTWVRSRSRLQLWLHEVGSQASGSWLRLQESAHRQMNGRTIPSA